MSGPINVPKLFTVEEANQLLPALAVILNDLIAKKCQVEDKQVEIDALELIADENTPKVRAELLARSNEFNELVNQFNERVKKIEETGCLLKDLDQGLIDFYGMNQGEVVFYCWKLGESSVTHWHEVGRGFADRKPLV